jgi:hypothetical protein
VIVDWIKSLFEGESHKEFKRARKDLHENRREMQKSISEAMISRRKSSQALKVAEHALKQLEKQQDDDCKK